MHSHATGGEINSYAHTLYKQTNLLHFRRVALFERHDSATMHRLSQDLPNQGANCQPLPCEAYFLMTNLHSQSVLGIFAALVLNAFGSIALAGDPRPNVVFIMADDLNCDLGCYGQPLVKSPHIDRLATRSVQFDRAYCQYPVCNPSRTSLLSGRRPQTTRVVDLVTPTRSSLGDVVMLPEHFRRNAYTTVKLGKIFHTGAAFEDPRSWDFELTETSEAKNPPDDQIAERRWGRTIMLDAADEATWDGKLAREARQQLTQLAGKPAPFFLAVGFRRPHVPYIAPRRYFHLYPESLIPPLAEPLEHLRAIPPLALPYLCYAEEKLESPHRQSIVAAYYAAVSFLDAQVGVMLDALDELRLWNDTVVIFTSDHGYHLGEHGGLWHKMTLFEESCHVPLLVAAPQGKHGVRTPGIVELLDLYPSLAELCGLPIPDGLEGKSFVPLLSEPGRAWSNNAQTVVSRVDGRSAHDALDPDRLGMSIRTDRWRYTTWPDGSRELYDHNNDAREQRNLIGLAEYNSIAAEHDELLKAKSAASVKPEAELRTGEASVSGRP
jgi:iduronate 2-sulfatase